MTYNRLGTDPGEITEFVNVIRVQKPTLPQPVRKFFAFYRACKFITGFIKNTFSYTEQVHCIPVYKVYYNIVFPFIFGSSRKSLYCCFIP